MVQKRAVFPGLLVVTATRKVTVRVKSVNPLVVVKGTTLQVSKAGQANKKNYQEIESYFQV
jgi:hypothetical protein